MQNCIDKTMKKKYSFKEIAINKKFMKNKNSNLFFINCFRNKFEYLKKTNIDRDNVSIKKLTLMFVKIVKFFSNKEYVKLIDWLFLTYRSILIRQKFKVIDNNKIIELNYSNFWNYINRIKSVSKIWNNIAFWNMYLFRLLTLNYSKFWNYVYWIKFVSKIWNIDISRDIYLFQLIFMLRLLFEKTQIC